MSTPKKQDLDSQSALDHNQLAGNSGVFAVPGGNSGECRVSAGAGSYGDADTLSIQQGDIRIGGSVVSISAQPASVATASNKPRKDLVVGKSDGTVTVINGEAEVPQYSRLLDDAERVIENAYRPTPPPAKNVDGVALAVVDVLPNDTDPTGNIHDRRAFVIDPRIDAEEAHFGTAEVEDGLDMTDSAIRNLANASGPKQATSRQYADSRYIQQSDESGLSVSHADSAGGVSGADVSGKVSRAQTADSANAVSGADVTSKVDRAHQADTASKLGGNGPGYYANSNHNHGGDTIRPNVIVLGSDLKSSGGDIQVRDSLNLHNNTVKNFKANGTAVFSAVEIGNHLDMGNVAIRSARHINLNAEIPGAPGGTGINLYYNNGKLMMVNDAEKRTTVSTF